jgi:hypothetical protein
MLTPRTFLNFKDAEGRKTMQRASKADICAAGNPKQVTRREA